MTDDGDNELRELRDRAERLALRTAIAAMENERAPWTARVQAVRGVMADAAARRNDEPETDKPLSEMTALELQRASERSRLRLERLLAQDAEIVEPAPTGASVFD